MLVRADRGVEYRTVLFLFGVVEGFDKHNGELLLVESHKIETTGEVTEETETTGEVTEDTETTGEVTENPEIKGEVTEDTETTGEVTEDTETTGEVTEDSEITGEVTEETETTVDTDVAGVDAGWCKRTHSRYSLSCRS